MSDKVQNEPTSFFKSIYDGAVEGDFSDNDSPVKVATQVGVGLIPVVGQIADARDTVKAVRDVHDKRDGAWANLGLALIGWLPIVGDLFKPIRRSGVSDALKGVDYAAGAVKIGLRELDPDQQAEAVTR
jgi:hypothetical protein